MRIGSVNGQIVRRVRKNSNGTTQVQPVKKQIIEGVERLVNDGEQFEVKSSDFKKHKV